MTREQVLQSVQPAYNIHARPYHSELKDAVQAMIDADRMGYPIDPEFVEIERDRLSRILDARK